MSKGTSIKDAIKMFEEKKGVVAAEVDKVNEKLAGWGLAEQLSSVHSTRGGVSE